MPDVEARLGMLQEVHSLCRDSLRRAKDRMVAYANTRRLPVSYLAGDRVLLASLHLSPEFLGGPKKKLLCVYVGPFNVLSATDNTVTLDIPPKFQRIHPTINVEYVWPYHA